VSLNEKHPYLTAWLGYAAAVIVVTNILLFIFGGFGFLLIPIVSFFAFKELTKHHLQPNLPENNFLKDKGFSNKFPFFTAWFVFFVFSLLPTFLISNISQLFDNPAIYLILEMVLWVFVNFFIYRFVVKKLLIAKFPPNESSENLITSGVIDE
jgi:quinol-cytochrome oxidoreductase complex cytochrome b subunit